MKLNIWAVALPLILCCSANATTCSDDPSCAWVVDEPTTSKEWVTTSTTEYGTNQSEEKFKHYKKHKAQKTGPNDQHICYVLQNGTETYGDYTVAKESPTSENVSLYKGGVLQRECNFRYYDITGGAGGHKYSKKEKSPWQTTTEGGYWKYSSVEKGHWECSTPVPEPATLILFGAGFVGLLGFKRLKREK